MAPNVLVEYKHDIKQLKSIMKIKGFQSKIYLHTTTSSNKEYWTEDNKKNVFIQNTAIKGKYILDLITMALKTRPKSVIKNENQLIILKGAIKC